MVWALGKPQSSQGGHGQEKGSRCAKDEAPVILPKTGLGVRQLPKWEAWGRAQPRKGPLEMPLQERTTVHRLPAPKSRSREALMVHPG